MAQNLECTIVEGESPNPDMPNPWQVQMRWFKREMNGEGSYDRVEIRSWTVDAPSELVAKTIQEAFLQLGDTEYDNLTNQGFQV